MSRAAALYESPLLRQVAGPALRPGGLALTQRALAWCGFAPGARVLDVGCGLGASAGHMAGEQGLRALGLDISPGMLREARRAQPGLPLIRASVEALPLADACLAGVLCECALSLTASPPAVLQECRRVLLPGGRLILSDIYLRQPPADHKRVAWSGCLGGALGQAALQAMVADAGLELLLWEDHSHLLRELAARLVWAHGSTEALWGACGDGRGGGAERLSRGRPGYFLMIAQRKVDALG
ncbi:hypothetical protein AAU61_07150 [Desulfocarbo indianensis]|nr:hypothetical protein AAU61_07150 [Desulfocarbo indianensis]